MSSAEPLDLHSELTTWHGLPRLTPMLLERKGVQKAALDRCQTQYNRDGSMPNFSGGQAQRAVVSQPQGGNDGGPEGARRIAARCAARQRGRSYSLDRRRPESATVEANANPEIHKSG